MTKKSTSLFVTALVALGGVAMTGCQQTSQNDTGIRTTRVVDKPAPTKVVQQSKYVYTTTGDSAVPPNARPGDCFTRVAVAPTYETVQETVQISAASQRIETIAAVYETVEERVETKPASYRLEVVPATYKTVEERVMISPAMTNLVEVPAKYETVAKRVMVSPERTEWKPGKGAIEKIDGATGEILCLVTIPAVYETVQSTVLVSPATTKEEITPATYDVIKKTVVDTAESTRRIEIPAEYGTVRRRVLVTPASSRVVEIPAKYDTVTRKVKVDDGRQDWHLILCETNVTPEIVGRIQQALQSAGHNPGPVNGELNVTTLAAVREFQVKNGLKTVGVTIETLDKLGVQR